MWRIVSNLRTSCSEEHLTSIIMMACVCRLVAPGSFFVSYSSHGGKRKLVKTKCFGSHEGEGERRNPVGPINRINNKGNISNKGELTSFGRIYTGGESTHTAYAPI